VLIIIKKFNCTLDRQSKVILHVIILCVLNNRQADTRTILDFNAAIDDRGSNDLNQNSFNSNEITTARISTLRF